MDAVHHSLQFACTGSLGCLGSCRRVLKEQKVTGMAKGANTLRMDSNNPLMLQRVTDPRVSQSYGVHRSGCGQVCLCMNPSE